MIPAHPGGPRHTRIWRGAALAAGLLLAPTVALSGCGSPASASCRPGVICAIGAENEYANVLSQIGGRYVSVASVLNNPNTDPHTFEVSPKVAEEVSAAKLVVQNGVGYDQFMNTIESASPSSTRRVIVAQHVLGLPDGTSNPHLWYDPRTMPAVARALTTALDALSPRHKAYFEDHLRAFDASLAPWFHAIAAFKARYAGTPVATTEPVADYLLSAMGAANLSPMVFQLNIMNGVDPSPQDITLENGLLTGRVVKVFCYNQQVVSSLTESIRQTAESANVPVVGVYETMPTPGYDYQRWMLAEVAAIQAAVVQGRSTPHL